MGHKMTAREMKYKNRIKQLEAALRDCLSYVDVDNLTMQTKFRNWQAVLDGQKFNPANCVVER